MNDVIDYYQQKSSSSNFPLIAVGYAVALLTTEPLPADTWSETASSPYSVIQQGSSFSAFESSLTKMPVIDSEFAKGFAAFYTTFAEGQEPLGRDFEEIWDTNATNLYEI